MARFRKKKPSGPGAINTSSLPDIVFMLLFFFMVSTTMKEVDLKVQVRNAEATELTKLEKKSLVTYIYVGVPRSEERRVGNVRRGLWIMYCEDKVCYH